MRLHQSLDGLPCAVASTNQGFHQSLNDSPSMAFTNHWTARYLRPPPITGWPTFSGLHQSLDSPPSEPYPQIVPLAVIAELIAIREEEK